MSALRITCPRCHAVLAVSNHQEESGHLGCTHCGQLIRLAQRQSMLPAMATAPMVAPAFSSGGYWNQNANRRPQGQTPWMAIAVSCLALFLTVLTVCATLLMFQFSKPSPTDGIATDASGPKFNNKNPFDAKIQPVVNDKAPQVADTPEPIQTVVPPPNASPAAPSNSPFGKPAEFAGNNSAGTGRSRPVPDLPTNPPRTVTPPTVTPPTPPTVEPAPPPPRPETASKSDAIG